MRRYDIKRLCNRYFYIGMHRDGVRAIFWGHTIRQFAAATVGLFVPIYVYNIGSSMGGGSMIAGIRMLILFLLLMRVSIIVASIFVEYLVDKIGFRLTLLTSSFFLFIKYLLLTMAEENQLFLWLAAVLAGIVTATYWIARHALFGEDQDVTNVGSSIGYLIVLVRVATVLGPVIGGLVAGIFGFAVLFYLGLVLVIISAVPYFFMQHHRRHHPDGVSGLFDKMRDPDNFPLMVSWVGEGWDNEVSISFWPLYIFVTLGAVEKLGFISSLVAVVSMFIAFVAGKVFDSTVNKRRAYLIGAGATAVIWPLKAFFRSFGSIFAVDSLHGIVSSFYTIPFISQTYRFAFRRDTVAFFAFREIIFSLGILEFLLLVYLSTFYWSWLFVFFLGALGVIVSMNLVSYRGFR